MPRGAQDDVRYNTGLIFLVMLHRPVEPTQLETAPVSNSMSDPIAAPRKASYPISSAMLRSLVLTLPRPPADAPETAWQEVVRTGLDELNVLDPRDAIETMLAIQIIGLHAQTADAMRLAIDPSTSALQALRHRASVASLGRVAIATMRLLVQQRLQPAVPARDWGSAADALTAVLREAPARPAEPARGAKVAEAEPEEVIRWIDEIDDDEMNEEIERLRRVEAGEPPLPARPGPRRIYKYKPDDYALRWVPDERAKRKYPGWENMTKAERREFFNYTYTGPVAPLEMLTPASRAAAAAGEK